MLELVYLTIRWNIQEEERFIKSCREYPRIMQLRSEEPSAKESRHERGSTALRSAPSLVLVMVTRRQYMSRDLVR
jgi:hypothetical protein